MTDTIIHVNDREYMVSVHFGSAAMLYEPADGETPAGDEQWQYSRHMGRLWRYMTAYEALPCSIGWETRYLGDPVARAETAAEAYTLALQGSER